MIFITISANSAIKIQSSQQQSDESRRTSRPRKPHKVVTFADEIQTELLPPSQRLAPQKNTPGHADKQSKVNNSHEVVSKPETNTTDSAGTGTVLAVSKQLTGTAASGEVLTDKLVDNTADTTVKTEDKDLNMDLDEQSIIR